MIDTIRYILMGVDGALALTLLILLVIYFIKNKRGDTKGLYKVMFIIFILIIPVSIALVILNIISSVGL